MSSTLEASVFMGKNYSEILHSIKNRKDLTMKQMFDISEKLIVGQSDGIFGMTPIKWEDSSWKQLSLVNDEEVISLSYAKVYVFSDSVLWFGKVNQNPTSSAVWEEKLSCFKDSPQYRISDTIDREPMKFECVFPRIHHIAAHQQSPRDHDKNGRSITIQKTSYLHVDVQ